MDATTAMNEIGADMHEILPPLQISSSGEPISLSDEIVRGVIAGIVVAAIVSRLLGREQR